MINNDFSKKFVKNAIYYATSRNYEIGTLEDAAGVSRGYLSRCLHGTKSIGLDSVIRISIFLKVNPMDILNDNVRKVVIQEQIERLQQELNILDAS